MTKKTLPASWSYVRQAQAASLARAKTRQTGFSRTGEKFHHPASAGGHVKMALACESNPIELKDESDD
jgi:hypothetical protein